MLPGTQSGLIIFASLRPPLQYVQVVSFVNSCRVSLLYNGDMITVITPV
jgi:hypothetical protein